MRNCDYVKGMKVKVPVQDALAVLAGPHPLSPLLRYWEPVLGLRAGRVPPGNSEQGRGVTLASLFGRQEWRLIWADGNGNFFRGAKWQINLATSEGGSIWWVFSAGQFGKFIQWVNLTSLISGFFFFKGKAKQKKRKVKHVFCRPVIVHHIDTVHK